MPTPYKFDIIASSENGLTGFDNTPSINDSGLISFVGNLNGEEDLFTGDASNPITNLSSSFPFTNFSSGIEINNDNQIVTVDKTSGFSAVRLWDADNPGSFRRTVAIGKFPPNFVQFENIFPFPSINNRTFPESQVAFIATPIGQFPKAAIETFAGEKTYNEALFLGTISIPMLADNGRVVARDASKIILHDYRLNPIEVIASDTNLGRAPGISDNGKAVAFYGDNAGEGIFISVETDSGWKRHRIAGAVGNRVLDPGETYEDTNDNGSFDSGEEENGLIGSFAPDERIGITYSETEDGGFGTVAYLAMDESGNESLISSQFNISDSSSEPNISHSEVAKVGEPANEVDAGLTGNIQDLSIYDPINNPGQIAFWAKTTTGKEAIVRANPIRKPVFIVPGIIGSLPKNEDVNEWLTNRGFSPDRLQPEQISNIYDDLIETLKRVGYVEGVDLFVATYDWRLNPAPIDGTIDGVIERSPTGVVQDSVSLLTDDTYEYSVDQFAFWLQESIEGWQSQFSDLPESEIPSLESVDVIAHSAGGATVRSYIQSDGYGKVFDQNGTKLPEIDNFISLGVPYRGASIPWNGLNNNFSGGAVLQLAKLIAGAAYAKARNGSTISLSGQNDVPEAITPQEVNTGTVKEFIEDYVPHLRALLATYPFIEDSSGSLKKAEELDPQSRNELLLDLNDGFDSINNEGGGNPTKFADKIGQLAVVYGSGIAANDALLQKTGPDFEQILDPSNPTPSTPVNVPVPTIATLNRGKVVPETDEIWYKNLEKGTADPDKKGDKTVPLLSATGIFSEETNNPNYRDNILFKDVPSVTHNQQPFDLEVQQYILDVLKIDLEEDLISTNLNETSDPDIPSLAFDAITFAGEFIQDPVEGFLVDNQGRRLGYTSSTGAVTEIPNSYWLGKEDGIGFFTEPVKGPFQLELTGLGEDYFVTVSLETEEGQAFLESEGFLAAGEQLTLDVPLVPLSLFTEIHTNAGGDAHTDTTGQQWLANLGFSNGEVSTTQNAISQTDDDVLYQSEYFGQDFDFNLAVENDSYDVTLSFAEVVFNEAGKRVFDVIAEDQLVLDDLDIYTETGGKNIALNRTFTVEVDDNSLDLNFLATVDQAKVSAIKIKPTPTTITGSIDNDILIGTPEDDLLIGLEGDDNLQGESGNDTLQGNTGNDTLDGGADLDTVTETADNNFTLTDTSLVGNGTDTLINIEAANITGGGGNNRLNAISATMIEVTLDGAGGNDSLYGSAKGDLLITHDGNDRLDGRNGNDSLTSGAGDDRLYSGNGEDFLFSDAGNDLLISGNKNDLLSGGLGDDTIDGGNGIDTLLETADANLTLTDTSLVGLGSDTLSNIEAAQITGGAGNNRLNALAATMIDVTLDGAGGDDSLYGSAKGDLLITHDGNDRLDARNGNDTLTSGAGDDTLYSGNGNDQLDGGEGNDILSSSNGDDTINGGLGIDTLVEAGNRNFTLTDSSLVGRGTDKITQIEQVQITAGAGNNRLNALGVNGMGVIFDGAGGNDKLYGGNQNDVLTTDDGNDRLDARNGNDTLTSGVGDDTLYGGTGDDLVDSGAGNDSLYGGNNNDTLIAGAGDDTIFGGNGSDVFVLQSRIGTDLIEDFNDGVDKFALEAELNYDDLSFSNNGAGTATIILDTTNDNQILAIISNVSADAITVDDFMSI